MEKYPNLWSVFLRELETEHEVLKIESMTLEEAISLIESESQSMAIEDKNVKAEELIINPLLRLANRINCF